MLYFIKIIYMTIFLPPGCFILLFLALGLYIRKRHKVIAAAVLSLNLLLYLFSIGLISDTLIASLEKRYTVPKDITGDVIIMLGGGTVPDSLGLHGAGNLSGYSANRLLSSIQLYKKLKVPIIVSGGRVFKHTGSEGEIARDILLSFGIPKEHIIVDDKSLNTEQNAYYCSEIIKKYNYEKPILVTSAFHMQRSVKLFIKAGVNSTPYPCDYQASVKRRINLWSFIPQANNLNNTSLAVKEYLGMLK